MGTRFSFHDFMVGAPSLSPDCFVVPRREFYRKMAELPEVIAMAKLGERLESERREDHDPGDEDRSGR